jgi:TATA-binding protein-associated factor Taf7
MDNKQMFKVADICQVNNAHLQMLDNSDFLTDARYPKPNR